MLVLCRRLIALRARAITLAPRHASSGLDSVAGRALPSGSGGESAARHEWRHLSCVPSREFIAFQRGEQRPSAVRPISATAALQPLDRAWLRQRNCVLHRWMWGDRKRHELMGRKRASGMPVYATHRQFGKLLLRRSCVANSKVVTETHQGRGESEPGIRARIVSVRETDP